MWCDLKVSFFFLIKVVCSLLRLTEGAETIRKWVEFRMSLMIMLFKWLCIFSTENQSMQDQASILEGELVTECVFGNLQIIEYN